MSDIVIRSDYSEKSTSRKQSKKRYREASSSDSHIQTNGMLVIPAGDTSNGPGRNFQKSEEKANVMVVSSINIKDTRKAILNKPMGYTPSAIVGVFRAYYTDDEKKNVMTMTIQDGDNKRKIKLSYSLQCCLGLKSSYRKYRNLSAFLVRFGLGILETSYLLK